MDNFSAAIEERLKIKLAKDHAEMVEQIVREEFFKHQPPRELSQSELAAVILNIANRCFVKGYNCGTDDANQ